MSREVMRTEEIERDGIDYRFWRTSLATPLPHDRSTILAALNSTSMVSALLRRYCRCTLLILHVCRGLL
jgi:hypothetical protein